MQKGVCQLVCVYVNRQTVKGIVFVEEWKICHGSWKGGQMLSIANKGTRGDIVGAVVGLVWERCRWAKMRREEKNCEKEFSSEVAEVKNEGEGKAEKDWANLTGCCLLLHSRFFTSKLHRGCYQHLTAHFFYPWSS